MVCAFISAFGKAHLHFCGGGINVGKPNCAHFTKAWLWKKKVRVLEGPGGTNQQLTGFAECYPHCPGVVKRNGNIIEW